MKCYDVAVIGGGASGITAAIFAARCGANVIIAERNVRIGKKILATGNGRCNLLNSNLTTDRFHGDRKFAEAALSSFGLSDMLSFFDSIGLPCVELENGKMFPKSLQATSVLDLLREELTRLRISVQTDFYVTAIKKIPKGFKIIAENGEINAHKLIVSCGGAAASHFGTDGSSYKLLETFGFKTEKIFPALLQLQTENTPKGLSGIKHNSLVTVFCEGKKIKSTYGEVLFTDYGLSGPPVFDISRYASEALMCGKETEISLDILNDIPYNELLEMLEKRIKRFSYLSSENFLNGLLPKKLGTEILKRAESPRDMARIIKNFKFKVIKTTGLKNAQVTAGGISTDFISPYTLMSEKVPNLYVTGEMLNVDGDCGGFNLSWAWCSGALAGLDAGKEYDKHDCCK